MPPEPIAPILAFDPATPSQVRALLHEAGITPNKVLGQNFLIDKRALDRIVTEAGVASGDHILEIGPGLGALTTRLCAQAAQIVAVEKDLKLLALLQRHLPAPNLRLLGGDALRVAWQDLGLPHAGVKVVANLPYSISKPMLRRLMEGWRPHLQSATLMVQREVADRLLAAPNTDAYGPMALMTQLHGQARKLFDLGGGAFLPPPSVSSSVVRIEMRNMPAVTLRDEKLFWQVVRGAFGTRRKQLGTALRALPAPIKEQVPGALQTCGIDPMRRGETLSLDEFAALSNQLAVGG